MGMFDNLQDKAKELIGEHGDKVEGVSDTVLEKAGDAVDGATGGKFTDKIDAASDQADGVIGN
jgi:hypothetical protein